MKQHVTFSKDAELYLSRMAQRASDFASETEGERGLAAGSGNIDYRWREGAMYDLRDALRAGKSLEEAEAIAKAKSKEAISQHNARRPRDINWKRWDESVYQTIEHTVRDLREIAAGTMDSTGALVSKAPAPSPISCP